jgi:rhodanese-related sulfurtransferase
VGNCQCKQPILIVCELGQEEETVTRLSRGFDNLIGHLAGGFDAWAKAGKEFDTVNRISAEFCRCKIGESKIIDIRKETEYSAEHIEDPTANHWPQSTTGKRHQLKEHFIYTALEDIAA